MAIHGFHITNLTERRGGAAAQRVMQYMTREGAYAPAAVDYLLRTSEDTVERGDFVAQTQGTLPTWAEGSAVRFFAEAEALERGGPQRGGRWATTWQISLPRELTREQQWTMGTAFVATHLTGHAYLCVMHDPVKEGRHQPHLHVLMSERVDHGQTRDAATYFRRPEVGGCGKERFLSQRNAPYLLRAAWADWMNYTLERAGHEARIHPRSLYARDIGRKPEPKVGWSTDPARQAERAAIRAQRDEAKELQLAHAGWEARKERLGLASVWDLEPERFLALTYTEARGQERGTWDPAWAREKAARLRAYDQREEARLMELHRQLTREETRLAHHRVDLERPLTPAERTRVVANGRTLGVDGPTPEVTVPTRGRSLVREPVLIRSPHREHGRGRPSRGRIFEEERPREREGYAYER